MMRGLACVCLWAAVAVVAAGESVSYTTDAFKKEVPKANHFVMFFAPWCEHCKRLAPAWSELAAKLSAEEAVVAKVDCTLETALCSENDVTGYPTLKFFKKGETDGLKFRGSRDLSSLRSFVFEQIGRTEEEEQAAPGGGQQERLVDYTKDTFHQRVRSGKHFVKFFAPWCGHCQKLAPTWEELAQSLDESLAVTVGKVDCTILRDVCIEFEVKGYPTMLWIEDGKKTEKYQGARTLEELRQFVLQRAASGAEADGAGAEAAIEEASPVASLSGESFEAGVASGVALVKFFAPWCGHCKRLAPTWDELAAKFRDNPDVRIAKVDCTLDENKDLCSAQKVNGFPTVFIYKDGDKVEEYNGSRSLDDLFNFVTKHASAKQKDEL
ncbi:Hypothetical predicted protein [Cloeon dipterum]|uniref:Thioredoxin domain-containing protein n=1 Tax=Cloeon dipterum TaxID=197152 RepID=A0A8S1D727_9INSE|nr:Hypothetical predicted protein [Cloeon dipterum]